MYYTDEGTFPDLINAISRDVIGFVPDPCIISPGGELSANVRKVMLLDEVTIQREYIDIQAAGEGCSPWC